MASIELRDSEPHLHRQTKIVCTLGPATTGAGQIAQLVGAGMDIARLDFSHGNRAGHDQIFHTVRKAAEESGRAIGILADLQGPKIRLGRFAAGPVAWRTGETIRITVDDVAGTHDRVSTTYRGLATDAGPGDRLLVDDGRVTLRVINVESTDVVCEVTEGGTVSDNKGICLPGIKRLDACAHPAATTSLTSLPCTVRWLTTSISDESSEIATWRPSRSEMPSP